MVHIVIHKGGNKAEMHKTLNIAFKYSKPP